MRLVFALMCLISITAFAADGDPDGSFAGGGIAISPMTPPLYVVAPGAAIAPDGSVLIAGAAGVTPGSDASSFAVTRFTPTGVVDSSFGNAGVALIDFSAGVPDFPAYAHEIARTPDGRWIVAGGIGAAQIPGVARLQANGTLDTTFGVGGRTELNSSSGNHIISALKVDAENRTWMLIAEQPDTVVRLSANGTLDTSFASGGKLALSSSCCTYHQALAFDAQGRILVGGARNTSPRGMSVQRFLPDGAVDTGFGSSGVFTFSMSADAWVQQLLPTPDGHIVAIGNNSVSHTTLGTGLTTAVRMTSGGLLDTGFGIGGSRVIDFGGEERGFGIVDNHALLGTDGKILIARATQEAAGVHVTRLLANGYPDATFGPGGKRTVLQAVGWLSFARPLLAPKRLLLTGAALIPGGPPILSVYAQAWHDGDGIFRNGVD